MINKYVRPPHGVHFDDLFKRLFNNMVDINMAEQFIRLFIQDMVTDKEIWQQKYSIIKYDLKAKNREIYDEIENVSNDLVKYSYHP